MSDSNDDIDGLLDQAARGEKVAVDRLFDLYRDRVRRMVQVRLDRKLCSRIDPSDVIQESFAEAFRRLPDFIAKRPIAFYPWLRQIAYEKVLQLRQHHVATKKRSILREACNDLNLPDDSVMQLADCLVASATSPSQRLIREELKWRVRLAMSTLSPLDQEVLILRYLEQLSTHEAIAVLGISEEAYFKRHLRAIQRLRNAMSEPGQESSP